MKGLSVTKNVKEIMFEGVWCELETKKGSREKNSQNIFLCEIAHIGKSLISIFQEFSPSIDKKNFFARRLYTELSFYEA